MSFAVENWGGSRWSEQESVVSEQMSVVSGQESELAQGELPAKLTEGAKRGAIERGKICQLALLQSRKN